jgi:hypothetical protein
MPRVACYLSHRKLWKSGEGRFCREVLKRGACGQSSRLPGEGKELLCIPSTQAQASAPPPPGLLSGSGNLSKVLCQQAPRVPSTQLACLRGRPESHSLGRRQRRSVPVMLIAACLPQRMGMQGIPGGCQADGEFLSCHLPGSPAHPPKEGLPIIATESCGLGPIHLLRRLSPRRWDLKTRQLPTQEPQS